MELSHKEAAGCLPYIHLFCVYLCWKSMCSTRKLHFPAPFANEKENKLSSETSRRELLRKPEGVSPVTFLPVFMASLELGPDDWDSRGHLKAQGSNLEQRSSSLRLGNRWEDGFCSSGACETTTDFVVAGKVNLANRLFL